MFSTSIRYVRAAACLAALVVGFGLAGCEGDSSDAALFLLLGVIRPNNNSSSDSGGSANPAVTGDYGSNNPNVYVAVGDSITLGANKPYPPYPERLAALLGKTVINAAKSGESAASGAQRMGSILAQYKPGHLLILYGINETRGGAGAAAGAESVRSIVRQAKSNKTVPVVATYYLMAADSTGFNPGIREINQDLRAMASQEGVTLVDLEAAFGSNDINLLYLPEGFHPNDAGTRLVARAFAAVLQ